MEHTFSVEVKSKKDVKNLSLSNDSPDHVLFEGRLGELEQICLVEDAVLELRGTKATIRVDLSRDEVGRLLEKKEPGKGTGSSPKRTV